MEEKQFIKIVSDNISKFRKLNGLTQAQLAEKLNYSDKSVSKWERGDGLPDAFVLYNLAELFGITVNDLLDENSKVGKEHKSKKPGHILITLLSVCIVWLVAAAAFFVLNIFKVTAFNTSLIFLYALPVSFIVLVVFSCLWWKNLMRFACVSLLAWSTALSIALSFSGLDSVWIIAAVVQIMAALWFYLRARNAKQKM